MFQCPFDTHTSPDRVKIVIELGSGGPEARAEAFVPNSLASWEGFMLPYNFSGTGKALLVFISAGGRLLTMMAFSYQEL